MNETTQKQTPRSWLDDVRQSHNNLSYWYPKVKDCGIRTPRTAVIDVPDDIVRCLFLEKEDDRRHIQDFVTGKVLPETRKMADETGRIPFLKNGNFSDKFRFGLCAPGSLDPETIIHSFIGINYDALCVDAGGLTEFVVRERIPHPQEMQTIYEGMPLNTEFRVFYNFNTHHVLYAVNYWDKEYCEKAISQNGHDAEAYKSRYPQLADAYRKNVFAAMQLCEKMLKDVEGLNGIWSVDLLLDAEDTFWLIDMAQGYLSAYWDPVKAALMSVWEPLVRCLSFIDKEKTDAILLAAGIGEERTTTRDVTEKITGLLLPFFEEITGTNLSPEHVHAFWQEHLSPEWKKMLEEHDPGTGGGIPFILVTLKAIEGWCGTFFEESRETERIRLHLRAADAHFDDIHQLGDTILIPISWGDWKHSHAYLEYLMDEIGYLQTRTEVTEEDGSDTYSADHYFIKITNEEKK